MGFSFGILGMNSSLGSSNLLINNCSGGGGTIALCNTGGGGGAIGGGTKGATGGATGGCGGNTGGNAGGKISLGSSLSTIVLGGTNICSSLGLLIGNLCKGVGSGMLGGNTGAGKGTCGKNGNEVGKLGAIGDSIGAAGSLCKASNSSLLRKSKGLPPLALDIAFLNNPIVNLPFLDNLQTSSSSCRCF